jgi:hypothetical protein
MVVPRKNFDLVHGEDCQLSSAASSLSRQLTGHQLSTSHQLNLTEDHENFRGFVTTNRELLKSGNCLIYLLGKLLDF